MDLIKNGLFRGVVNTRKLCIFNQVYNPRFDFPRFSPILAQISFISIVMKFEICSSSSCEDSTVFSLSRQAHRSHPKCPIQLQLISDPAGSKRAAAFSEAFSHSKLLSFYPNLDLFIFFLFSYRLLPTTATFIFFFPIIDMRNYIKIFN